VSESHQSREKRKWRDGGEETGGWGMNAEEWRRERLGGAWGGGAGEPNREGA